MSESKKKYAAINTYKSDAYISDAIELIQQDDNTSSVINY